MMRRYFLAVLAGLFLVLLAGQTSLAAKEDKYPSKTITWLINAAPGGGFDLHSRAVARVMRKKLGVNIIIRNVPGAGGVISWNLLTVAKPWPTADSTEPEPQAEVESLGQSRYGVANERTG